MNRLTLAVAALIVGPVAAEELALVAGGTADPKGRLVTPFAVEFDRDGAAYAVELDGHRVVKLEADGRVTRIAGDGQKGDTGDHGPAIAARLNGPHNLAIAADGAIYVADTWNNKVRKIDRATGTISTFAGTGKKGFTGDGGPADQAEFAGVFCVCLNPQSTALYVADLDNRRIRKIDLKSKLVTTVAGNGKRGVPADFTRADEQPLVDPRAAAVDESGTIYILERNGHALRVVGPDGKIRTLVNAKGVPGNSGDGGPARDAKLNGPKHLCLDAAGEVLIADAENHVIRRYQPKTGLIHRLAGTGKPGFGKPGPNPLAVALNRPHGVTGRPDGSVVITDSYNHRVLKWVP